MLGTAKQAQGLAHDILEKMARAKPVDKGIIILSQAVGKGVGSAKEMRTDWNKAHFCATTDD